MKTCLIIVIIFFSAQVASAAKASAVIVGTNASPGQVQVSVAVSEDSGQILFSTSFTINFTSSPNQLNADIKQRVRDELVRYGIPITVNDILLFGGAQ